MEEDKHSEDDIHGHRVNRSKYERSLVNQDEGILEVNDPVENCIQMAGGFGRMQWLLLAFALCSYIGNNMVSQSQGFLKMTPEVKCDQSPEKQYSYPYKGICSKGNLMEGCYPVISNNGYIINWITHLKMYCIDKIWIDLLFLMQYLGYAVSGLFLKQSDIIGRKRTIIIGLFIQAICLYGIYFSNSLGSYYVLLLVIGISYMNNISLFIYLSEIVPKKHQHFVCVLCFILLINA